MFILDELKEHLAPDATYDPYISKLLMSLEGMPRHKHGRILALHLEGMVKAIDELRKIVDTQNQQKVMQLVVQSADIDPALLEKWLKNPAAD